MSALAGVVAELNEIERTLGRWFRRDVIADCNDRSKAAVDGFNEWSRTATELLRIDGDALDARHRELTAAAGAIEESVAALDAHRAVVEASSSADYNRLVAEHNARVADHRQQVATYNAAQEEYNTRAAGYRSDCDRRKRQVEREQEAIRREVAEYHAWNISKGDEQFFHQVNDLYARLSDHARCGGADAGAVKAYLNQVRLARRELGAYARRRQEQAEHGVLIAEAKLLEDECHLVVDTGSTTVTVSPEIVRAAGLTGALGEEIEIVTAGGLRVRGRKLALPRLTVQGMTAENVDAVQLPESQCGVDGLLGLSFLNRFNYAVERERPQRLRLSMKGDAIDAYDVFISYKSEDQWWARVVYDALVVMRYKPFLSDVSLREAHTADYGHAIEAAVASARHLVVVGSSAQNMTSPWVEKEWRMFEHQKMTKRKTGSLVTVVCGDMQSSDLPPMLSMVQSVPITRNDFRERLRDFLPLV